MVIIIIFEVKTQNMAAFLTEIQSYRGGYHF
jgi:hypothetical protein